MLFFGARWQTAMIGLDWVWALLRAMVATIAGFSLAADTSKGLGVPRKWPMGGREEILSRVSFVSASVSRRSHLSGASVLRLRPETGACDRRWAQVRNVGGLSEFGQIRTEHRIQS